MSHSVVPINAAVYKKSKADFRQPTVRRHKGTKNTGSECYYLTTSGKFNKDNIEIYLNDFAEKYKNLTNEKKPLKIITKRNLTKR